MREPVVIATCVEVASSLARTLVTIVRGVAFWTAILLPVVYLPPLLFGHPAVVDPSVLATVVAVNVAAIAVGHRHGLDDTGQDATDGVDDSK